jgi:NTE family protein
VDVTADYARTPINSVLDVLNRALYIQSERLAQDELARAQVVIRPQLGDVTMMDLSKSDDCIDAGILAGRRAAPAIKRLILDKRFLRIFRFTRVKS